MKQTYKALTRFQGHEPGDEFVAEFDPWLEQQFIDLKQIQTVTKKKKEDAKDE